MITTPPTEAAANVSNTVYAAYLPRDVPYNEAFEKSLQHALEHPPYTRDGITVLPNNSPVPPEPGVSVRARDVDAAKLPHVPFAALPLPLDDSRRVYASPVPGVRLTHPGGYLEGGPGFAPGDDAFVQEFIHQFGITDAAQLRDARDREIDQCLNEARERMQAKRDALEHNARIENELKTLMDQRDMELKIETRMRDEARERRERREKRMAMKSAG